MTDTTITCQFCHQEFTPARYGAASGRVKFCSPECKSASRRKNPERVHRPRVPRPPLEPRICIQCGQTFMPQKAWAEDDPQQRGRFCSRACKQTARNQTPEHKADVLARYYVRKYGITQDEATEMRKRGCDICGRMSQPGRWDNGNLMIDHDHKTGKVRGVLCHSCNVLIGHAEDDPERLEAAAAYLRYS